MLLKLVLAVQQSTFSSHPIGLSSPIWPLPSCMAWDSVVRGSFFYMQTNKERFSLLNNVQKKLLRQQKRRENTATHLHVCLFVLRCLLF